MFGYISTKNLYLLFLREIKDIKILRTGPSAFDYKKRIYLDLKATFALAKKNPYDNYTFKDIFTGTEYHMVGHEFDFAGSLVIDEAKPVSYTERYQSLKRLKEQLQLLNVSSQEELGKQKVKQRI